MVFGLIPVGAPGPTAPALPLAPQEVQGDDLMPTPALDQEPDGPGAATSAVAASVWDEALLLVAQQLNDHDEDAEEEAPEGLLPDLLALTPD